MRKTPNVVIDHGARIPEERHSHAWDPALNQAIGEHVTRNFARPTWNLRDTRTDVNARIDIQAAYDEKSDSTVLYTSGMSVAPLGHVDGRLELSMRLPGRWPLDEAALADPNLYWPLGWLRYFATLAHRKAIGYRDLDDAGPIQDPSKPLAVPFNGIIFLPSEDLPDLSYPKFEELIHFLNLFPVYESELALYRQLSRSEVLRRLRDTCGDLRIVDPGRVSTVDPRLVKPLSEPRPNPRGRTQEEWVQWLVRSAEPEVATLAAVAAIRAEMADLIEPNPELISSTLLMAEGWCRGSLDLDRVRAMCEELALDGIADLPIRAALFEGERLAILLRLLNELGPSARRAFWRVVGEGERPELEAAGIRYLALLEELEGLQELEEPEELE